MALWLVLGSLVGLLTTATSPTSVGAATPPNAPPASSAVGGPSDVAVTLVGDSAGLRVLVAGGRGSPWRTAALLSIEGIESEQWVGYSCTTGNGRFVAVSFAPEHFANSADASDRGAFAAVVDLAVGSTKIVSARVGLHYHTPSCGTRDEIVFTRYTAPEQAQTEILRVDGATAAVTSAVTVGAQVTSVNVADGRLYGAVGAGVVQIGADGALVPQFQVEGPAFGIHPSGGGGLDLMVAKPPVSGGELRIDVVHADLHGGVSPVASGSPASVSLFPGRDGINIVAGAETVPAGLPLKAISNSQFVHAESISLDGNVAVARATSVPGPTESATARGNSSSVRIEQLAASGAALPPVDVDPGGPVLSANVGSDRAGVSTDGFTVPTCAIPRNDPSVQVRQPNTAQIEWAADQATAGTLAVARPANWNGNGVTTAYTPESLFPAAPAGGIQPPALVLLGIMAQESNLKEASYHAFQGVAGSPLVADYYGAKGTTSTIDYSKSDCGYGLGQLTTGMRVGDTSPFSANQQKAIATDYAANVAATRQALVAKWNELNVAGLVANSGGGLFLENWYFAVWSYNSGFYPYSTAGSPYGLGWTNNPANADYPPNRLPFLDASYDDAKHPKDWPYQERVFGWIKHPQLDYQGSPSYLGSNVRIPDPFQFCVATVNQCSQSWVDPTNPALSYCQRTDRACWWHTPTDPADQHNTWIDHCGDGACRTDATRYGPGAGEPAFSSPFAIDCDSSPPAVLSAAPVVIGTMPNRAPNLAGCGSLPNPGTFTLTYGVNAGGAPTGLIDTHQLGAGWGGHEWFTHTIDGVARPESLVTGTWVPPATVGGWQRIYVHVPVSGATTSQASYTVTTSSGQSNTRAVNQRWNENRWVPIGTFLTTAGQTSVKLTNATADDFKSNKYGQVDIAFDAVAYVPAVQPTKSYVAFGDSYSAGEGDEPYYSASDIGGLTPSLRNACHRSPQAYPALVAPTAPTDESFFLACSGAVTNDILGDRLDKPAQPWQELPQINQGYLDENTTTVTVGIGGNDAGFADVLAGCVKSVTLSCADSSFRLSRHVVGGDPSLVQNDPASLLQYEPVVIDRIGDRLEKIYRLIHQKAPNAQIIAVGYPRLFETGVGLICPAQATVALMLQYFNEWTDRLNGVIQRAAINANATFADLRDAYAGHGISCSPNAQPWVNNLIAQSNSGSSPSPGDIPGAGSFHPRPDGHAAAAAVVRPLIDNRGSAYKAMVPPTRVLDSRTATGGWSSTRLTSSSPRELSVTGIGGMPSGATAVVMNVTVTGSDVPSFLTVYPSGGSKPNASNLNFGSGETIANLTTTRIGIGGKIQFATANGSVDVIVDILGYYDAPGAAGGSYVGINPVRLLDSRTAVGGWSATLGAAPRNLQVVGGSSPVPAGATSVILNVTVTNGTAGSFLQAWPAGVNRPTYGSNINFGAGQTISNLVVVGIGAGGAVSFFNAVGSVNVIADVVGYFGPTGSKFHPLSPVRILDDRTQTGVSGPFVANVPQALLVGGNSGIPTFATGVVMNATVTNGSTAGILTVYPDPPAPGISNILYAPGQTIPNLVMVKVSADRRIRIQTSAGSVDVIGDVEGYFSPV